MEIETTRLSHAGVNLVAYALDWVFRAMYAWRFLLHAEWIA